MSAQAPDMEIPLTPQQQTEEVLRRLQAGELTGRVKVIILIGPCGSGKANLMKLFTGRDIVIGHRLQDGTVRPTCLLASHNGQAYIFIDTPGFGHPDFTKYEIKEKILGLLGYFTRTLGGVHGFLFIQSARETRPTPGIRDSVSFLKESGVDRIMNRVTFILTHWDVIAPIERADCYQRENEYFSQDWKSFNVSESGGSRIFRNGVSCDRSTEAQKDNAKRNFVARVLSFYSEQEVQELAMPFGELKFREQTSIVVEKAIIAGATACGVGLAGFLGAVVYFAAEVGELVIGASITIVTSVRL